MNNTNNQILKNTNAKILDEFNASIMFDKELYAQDIQGSLAHAKMLFNQKILSKDEFNKIENGLNQVKNEIENKTFNFSLEYEDIHMAIESRLTEIVGEPGKKLHTARSRNDQVAVDFTLYVQHKTIEISKQLNTLISTFTNIASKHTHTLLPGMTHLQHAQPINFGYHLMAYANMFKRDYERFVSSHKRNNYCPLGSAALAGTPHNINREQTAKDLGFSGPTLNAMDSVSNRDFALEILFNISTTMMHISRIAEELVQWSSYEFKFINISDEYATTSSIMPQKKNPDVPELLRGKTGRAFGNLFSLLTVMKGLPLAYNKDTQEDKEGVFDSVKTISISISILNEIIKTMKVNEDKMFEACQVGHLTATDFADYLVKHNNMPFRNAYYLTKDVVAYANTLNKDISQLSLEEIKASNENLKDIDSEITTFLNLKNSMNSRNSLGGTSTKQTESQINFFKNWLKNNK